MDFYYFYDFYVEHEQLFRRFYIWLGCFTPLKLCAAVVSAPGVFHNAVIWWYLIPNSINTEYSNYKNGWYYRKAALNMYKHSLVGILSHTRSVQFINRNTWKHPYAHDSMTISLTQIILASSVSHTHEILTWTYSKNNYRIWLGYVILCLFNFYM